ncbi:MAG: hypothetical protein R3E21_07700 [Caenibius sp.]
MTEERHTEVETPDGKVHTHTTIIREEPASNSGVSIWFILFVILLSVAGGIWAFTQLGGAEAAKDNAIAEAADSVGNAADQVGEAAGEVGAAAQKAADKVTGE